jgi:hypothetical protein
LVRSAAWAVAGHAANSTKVGWNNQDTHRMDKAFAVFAIEHINHPTDIEVMTARRPTRVEPKHGDALNPQRTES